MMLSLKKLQCNDTRFTLGCALLFTLLNALFIQRSWAIIAPARLHDFLFALSVPVVLFCGLVTVFSLLNIPLIRKPPLILLTLGCAGPTWLLLAYGAVIDQNLMVNVVETKSQEATALLTPPLRLWRAISGLIPSAVLAVVRSRPAE